MHLVSQEKISGIEILNASEFFGELELENSSDFLENMADAEVIIREKMEIAWIILKIKSKIGGREKSETFRFEVPYDASEEALA